MDAYQSQIVDLTYSDEPSVLLVASSDAAMSAAQGAIEASNSRISAKLPIEIARERIARQAKASAVWIEIDRDDEHLEELLSQVARDVDAGRYGAVVSTKSSLIDPLFARLEDSSVEFIADADGVERITALATVVAQGQPGHRIAEANSDRSSERLRQLSEEVSRIASTLARLSTGPGKLSDRREFELPITEAPSVAVETVRSVIQARRLRSRFFSEELFADPAWDMLLDLLKAEIEQVRVPVSSLCIAAAVPATTALRWLKTMVGAGIFVRRADPHDGRRIFVELAPEASSAMRRYFAEVRPVPVI